MNYKKIFKRETKVIIYVVVCLTLVVIGGSYALFLQVNNNSNNQEVHAGSLVITYDGGNTVVVPDDDENCLTPQADDDGKSTGCNFKLSISNAGSLPMQYNLLIYNNESDAPSNATLVDQSIIKYSLNKKYNVAGTSSDITSTDNNIGSLAVFEDPDKVDGDPEKKVLETSIIAAGETIEFSLNIWIDETASTDIVGQYVYLKVDVAGSVYEIEPAIQTLTAKDGSDGLTLLTNTSSVDSEEETTSNEYRYTGANPNNYVYYNCTDSAVNTCEKWRILGIYNVDNTSRIKIVNSESTLSQAWDSNSINTFSTSTLNDYLNITYYNTLSSTAQSQLAKSTYYLGGVDSLDINSREMYASENLSSEKIVTNIGLMSLSDYTFASGINDAALISGASSNNSTNWLYKNTSEWLINKNTSNEIYYIDESGNPLASSTSTDKRLIRPVVYLASNIKITGGDGTKDYPYELSK
jgi:hypothetical protein